MTDTRKKPEWTPEDAGEGFTSEVMPGVEGGHDGVPGQGIRTARTRRKRPGLLPAQDYIDGVLKGDLTVLSRAITLVESNSPKHREVAREVLRALLPHGGNSIRVGISGTPGAGKSTFIESLGEQLCNQGKRVAVLAVDPSSSVTGGSILGDKTRMEKLSRRNDAFIRPSPSGGALGGVTRKSRETILLCEAAGFDVILVETVGVGQNEITVRSMVDFFLLLQIAGAGDELQGIKKGVIEISDAIIVNKADGENLQRAKMTCGEYARVLRYLHPYTHGWTPRALACSALTGDGVPEVWAMVETFRKKTQQTGAFAERRRKQKVEWLDALVEVALKDKFLNDPRVREALPGMEDAVAKGELPAMEAMEKLMARFES